MIGTIERILFADETTEAITTAEDKITSRTYWENKLDEVLKWITTNGIKMLLALIVLFILFKIVNVIARRIKKNMVKRECDPTFTIIVTNVFRKGIKILLFVAYLAFVGIDTASIGAVIASCGVGIGLALQGSLSNLAGGIIIVIVRPFKLGDYIEAQGEGGTVEDIRIFYTYIATPDNRTVMIPNGVLANGVIRNNSMKDRRRVDFKFSVSYDSDLKLVKETLLKLVSNDARVLKDPSPFAQISEYGNSSITFTVRAWVKATDYWNVYFAIMEQVKEEFDNNGIQIPFNQLDVTIRGNKNE
ncbi:MAG: mechanosensitive ion channel [Acholeplasmatales bacterium]|nr:mechanosensitive ion channel [Acholeplasmatales bacterium]